MSLPSPEQASQQVEVVDARGERERVIRVSQEARESLGTEIAMREARSAVDVANLRAPLEDILKDTKSSVWTQVETILDSVMTPPTADGEPIPKGLDRYLTRYRDGKTEDGTPRFRYKVNLTAVKGDSQGFLKNLQTAFPEHAGVFGQLRQAVDAYAIRWDEGRMKLQERFDAKGQRVTGRALSKAGRMAGFLAAGTAAALSGVVAIANKKMTLTPFLYAGIAGLIASPKLRTHLFGKQNDVLFMEINRVLNNRAFLKMSQTYNIKGPIWESIATDVLSNQPAIRTMEKALAKGRPTEEQIQEFLDEEAGNDTSVRGALQEMIRTRDWTAFTTILREAKNKDARELVVDYIKRGAADYRSDMKVVATLPSS